MVRVFNLTDNTKNTTFNNSEQSINCVDLIDTHKLIITGGNDMKIRIYKLYNSQSLKVNTGCKKINCISMTRCGLMTLIGGDDHIL